MLIDFTNVFVKTGPVIFFTSLAITKT